MKVVLTGLMVCLSFSLLKSQDSTLILRKEYLKMIEQENNLSMQIYQELDYRHRCSTKMMYKLSSQVLQPINNNLANEELIMNDTKILQDSISKLQFKVGRLMKTVAKRKESESISHFGRTLANFNLEVCPCSTLTSERPEVETMLFTFFKEHNRYLLELNTSAQFQELSPSNMPKDVLFWCIPTKFYLINELESIDNVQNGNVKVSDLQNSFKDETVKFTRIRRIAK